jgi:small subunit ribosomal protein S11
MDNLCIVHINSTLNNTILTAMDLEKKTLKSRSLGAVLKSKRGKRSIAHGSQLAGESLGISLKDIGFLKCQIRVKGFGNGRQSAIQGLVSSGLFITDIIDVTNIPHNGCRPPKRRRL